MMDLIMLSPDLELPTKTPDSVLEDEPLILVHEFVTNPILCLGEDADHPLGLIFRYSLCCHWVRLLSLWPGLGVLLAPSGPSLYDIYKSITSYVVCLVVCAIIPIMSHIE